MPIKCLPSKAHHQKLTIIRDKVYDITGFIDEHPGGSDLLKLAVGRDSTDLYESYHFRHEVANARLQTLPRPSISAVDLRGHSDFDARPSCLPGFPLDSQMYVQIKKRVKDELFKPMGKTSAGGGMSIDIAFAVVPFSLCVCWFVIAPSIFSAVVLGICGSLLGMIVMHAANHGAISSHFVSKVLSFSMDVLGPSSVYWRYHHSVSHHVGVNNPDHDEDHPMLNYPMLRTDPSQRRQWFHKYQWIYIWPLISLGTLVMSWNNTRIIHGKSCRMRESGVRLLGVTFSDTLAYLLIKLLHIVVFLVLPYIWSGSGFVVIYYIVFHMSMSSILFAIFLTNHWEAVGMQYDAATLDDWCKLQISQSVSWGGACSSFLTGGLSLQIEHHLFPSLPPNLLASIAPIVREECQKHGMKYASYETLPQALLGLVFFLREAGQANEGKLK